MNINKRVLPPACDNYHGDKIDCFQLQACVLDLNYGMDFEYFATGEVILNS